MVRPSRCVFCQRQLFLQLTTCSKTERVLFNLKEQAITEVLVVKVIIYIRNQTSDRNKDLPKTGADRQQLPCVQGIHTRALFCFS